MSKFEGTVDDIIFRNETNGWTVVNFHVSGSGHISAVGILPFLNAGEHVILDGELTQHRDYGEQIKVSSYETVRPETKTDIEKYLGSGLIKGMGPATAKLIVQHFGVEAMDILESDPKRLIEIPGIGPKRAAQIAESFAMQNEMHATLLFLQSAGLSAVLSTKVYRAYGDQSEHVLRSNPFRLADEIEGIGFQTADRIAQSLGFLPTSPERLRSGVRYVLSEAVNASGHVYLPFDLLGAESARILGVDNDLTNHTVQSLLMNGSLIEDRVAGERAIYLPKLYKTECEVANLLLRLRDTCSGTDIDRDILPYEIEQYELNNEVRLCDRQRDAVIAAATGGITIITGGPGTGKTTSINCILYLLRRQRVELCAPTGRAAKRMSEATGHEARTIHRLLEYGGDAEGFQRDEENPIEADVVIVDEVSMVDIFMMKFLLRAMRRNTRLILVGDADQLPSVGAGNVLHDLIASGSFSTVRLDQIFRQAEQSCIITNAHRINRGEYPIIRNRDTDFFLKRCEDANPAAQSVIALVRDRLPKYLSVDAMRGIQVMAPMKKGALGVYQLNASLQEALNPPARAKAELRRTDGVFRLGDKVMQIVNDYDIEWTRNGRHGKGAFNGDIGYIIFIDTAEREICVEFDDGRRANYDESMLDELELSYCISVHKSQGSEFDAVVLPLVSGPHMLMTRNLLYTAVTRAKRLVVIVGRETCMRQMVDNNMIRRRYSALALRLRGMEDA